MYIVIYKYIYIATIVTLFSCLKKEFVTGRKHENYTLFLYFEIIFQFFSVFLSASFVLQFLSCFQHFNYKSVGVLVGLVVVFFLNW